MAGFHDVIVFDAADDGFSVGFNPLACSSPGRHDLVADGVFAAFEEVHDLEDTPRLKDTLWNALYVLVEKGMTLVNLLMMLSEASYRDRLTEHIEDEVVRMFGTTNSGPGMTATRLRRYPPSKTS